MTGDGRLFVWTKLPRGEIALFGSSPPPRESLENTNGTSSRQTSDAKNAFSAPWNVGKERGADPSYERGTYLFNPIPIHERQSLTGRCAFLSFWLLFAWRYPPWILCPQCDKNTKPWKLHIQVSSHYNSSVKGCLSLFLQWWGVHAVKWLLLWLTPKLWLIHLILCARILFCLPSHARWLSAHSSAVTHLSRAC